MSKVVPLRQRQESARFEALVKPHFPALYAAAYRLSNGSADAEDLLQEVFIKASRHRAELEAMEYPRAWLLRTLYNQFVDARRREERRPSWFGSDQDPSELAASPASRPDEETERRRNAEAVQKGLARLGHEARSLLMMHDIDGLTLPEIREATGLPLGTIKSRLHRARVKLGRLLVRDEGPAEERSAGGKTG